MSSSIGETFRDRTVLFTGSTGFLGKVLKENCSDLVPKIYCDSCEK